MTENVFIALDLAGAVRAIALCEEAAGIGIDAPGWLVRSRILRMHSWIGAADPTGDPDQTRQQILSTGERWQIPPNSMRLVLVSHAGRAEALHLADAVGCSWVCIPQAGYVISPRGLAPAVTVKDYAHPLNLRTKLDLRAVREAFVPMMEQAADDVQKEGLEQDDSFLDRYVEIRIPGEPEPLVVPMETLTDEAWLLSTWCQLYAEWRGRPLDPDRIELVALRLRCAVGAPDHGFRPGAHPRPMTPLRAPAGWQCETTPLGHLLCQTVRS